MKAFVFQGIGDIRLETVREPKIHQPTDALIRITFRAVVEERRNVETEAGGA